jgi:hypothetical protein
VRLPALVPLAFVLAAVFAPSPARALEEFTPTLPLGMGGASRAWALGDAGPLLNPSGMSLEKAYTVGGTYGYASRLSDQFLHASIVDSTSSYGLAGGLYYTYSSSSPSGAPGGHGNEGGVALSMPIGPYVAVGGTLKYLWLAGDETFNGNSGGLTFDVGVTVRPLPMISLGVVGANLRSLDNSQAPQSIGYGAAWLPFSHLIVALDGLTSLTADNYTGRKGTSIMGGGSYTLWDKLGMRAGGGYDASTGNGYATLGVTGIFQVGAVDASVRQDLTQGELAPGVPSPRATVVGVSLRLFIPASQTQDPSQVSGPDFVAP